MCGHVAQQHHCERVTRGGWRGRRARGPREAGEAHPAYRRVSLLAKLKLGCYFGLLQVEVQSQTTTNYTPWLSFNNNYTVISHNGWLSFNNNYTVSQSVTTVPHS